MGCGKTWLSDRLTSSWYKEGFLGLSEAQKCNTKTSSSHWSLLPIFSSPDMESTQFIPLCWDHGRSRWFRGSSKHPPGSSSACCSRSTLQLLPAAEFPHLNNRGNLSSTAHSGTGPSLIPGSPWKQPAAASQGSSRRALCQFGSSCRR